MNAIDVILILGGLVAAGGLILVLWDRLHIGKHHT